MFNEWRGREGAIVVPGLGAVFGMFSSWTLTRRGDSTSEALRWDLYGVLSYVNETLLRQEGVPLKVRLRTQPNIWKTANFDRADLQINGDTITIKGVILNG